MAVYEGARQRTGILGRRRPELPVLRPQAPSLPRRRARAAIRAQRRPRLVGFVVGGIVLAFLLGFFSLVQTVRVSASDYDIGRLDVQYQQLLNQRQQIVSELDGLGSEPGIRQSAIGRGLSQLPAPIVLPSR